MFTPDGALPSITAGAALVSTTVGATWNYCRTAGADPGPSSAGACMLPILSVSFAAPGVDFFFLNLHYFS